MMITTSLQIQILIYFYTLLFMTSPSLAFKLWKKNSNTHRDITVDAILQTTADVCKFQAQQTGNSFVMPSPLTIASVAKACKSDSVKSFEKSINKITRSNAWIDFRYVANGSYHFDNELFSSGRQIITDGLSAVKVNVKDQSYVTAREALGSILHTLQDFYSHSNWIELGRRKTYSNLIKRNAIIDNIADSKTCRPCTSDGCRGNILEDIIKQQKLTSGFFGFSKPEGKCSHGGLLDPSSWGEGGINKDDLSSNHGYLHSIAASVATAASKELLQDIRATVGDSAFLRLMGLSQTSVLCFVIDTTGSMSDDIAEVRRVTSSIIDSKTGTAIQPSEYILVPFNDPDYGPLTRTTDPKKFKNQLGALTATGGGDAPEMCLSALQLALTGSPPQTEIFVFTDADAKDKNLKSTVQALIEMTKSKVSFMLTNALGSRRRRSARAVDGKDVSTRLSNPQNQVYQDLAQSSGGQAIEVTKTTLDQATDIIAIFSKSTLVTLFQAVRNPAKAENFSVFVDSSVQNLTFYITGNSPNYNIMSPSGVSQSSDELNGTLGPIQKVGNLHKMQPNVSDKTGLWLFSMNSTQPYTIRVVGQSEIDFLFDFVELSQGLHPSYAVLNSRPTAKSNVTLLVSMVGGDSVKPTEVSLVETSSSNSLNGTLEEVASGQYLVTFNSTPAGEFTVRVVGQISSISSTKSSHNFHRQSPTQFQASNVTITTQPVGTTEPGKNFTLPFTVATSDSGGSFNIKVSNDRNFAVRFNTSITLGSDGSANDSVTLNVPENTPSGTDVTVTIQAEAPDQSTSNYAVLRLAVIAPVTDFTPPVCEAVSINANCSGNCSLSSWYLTTNVTDGNGSGIQNVRILQGNGSLDTTTVLSDTGVNVTMVVYNSSCCSPDLELVAVDATGNVATCYKTVRETEPNNSTVPPVTTTNTTTTPISTTPPINQTTTNHAECCLFLPVFLWLNVGISFYQFMQL